MLKIYVLALLMLVGNLNASPVQRIMGGAATSIEMYPFATPLLRTMDFRTYVQTCAGTILTKAALLTAAHCIYGENPNRWRFRVGSTFASSEGLVYDISNFILHSKYNLRTYDNDVAIIKSHSTILLGGGVIEVATVAGANYRIADNQPVWAIGWGSTSFGGQKSESLRHVQVWTVNQYTCRFRYADLGLRAVTDNMLCAGWLDVGGRDQCQDDAGGPLLHNDIVVGIVSWGHRCGLPRYPGVYTRLSSFNDWIALNS
ncbi:trypsin, alkaline B-like [Bicyclus anynana]|uniref:Trypsin, alkaline B-like n=1 Tax=Bicyclus anynana TaxID=110368 RepID=A0A6J1MS91_BICAN|nr:trypsin, alkaline B-like [Bicyclus anynana]